MKKFILLVVFFAVGFGKQMRAQDEQVLPKKQISEKASVEPLLWGIQLGTVGLRAHAEIGLSDRFILRTEAGLKGNFSVGFVSNVVASFALAPCIQIEPRWYYFLVPGGQKNDGSFLTVAFFYINDWFIISNDEISESGLDGHIIAAVPKWGIKKTYFDHLTLEAGIGIGVGGVARGDGFHFYLLPELHLRVGFTL